MIIKEFQKFLKLFREILVSLLFFVIFTIFPLSFLIPMIIMRNSKSPEKNSIASSLQRVFRVCREILFPSLFLSLSSFRVFASSFLIPEITTSFRELETINSITSGNAWYYYGAILGQPAHQTKTIRARPIIVRDSLSFSLSPRLGRSNSLGVGTSSRPSVQLASCGVKLRFTASNPSFQVGSNDLSTSRLDDSINAPLITIFIEWMKGGGEGCDDRVLSNELDFQGSEETRR